MMTALHANGVHLVLVEKLDRLAHDLMIQETIIGDLRKHGFDVMAHYRTATPCGRAGPELNAVLKSS